MAYIYEHIRTQGFEPLHFEEHFTRLNALARELFLAPLAVEHQELQRQIAERLRKEGCSPLVKNAVVLRYHDDRAFDIEVEELLYDTFSVRAIHPQLCTYRLSGDLLTENTSAKEALLELNHTMAHISEQGVPLWINDEDEILAIDGAPVIAVFDNEIKFSRMGKGVEFNIAYGVANKIKRNISKEAIMLDDLGKAKELLYIDYRGITAVEAFESHYFMDITASKLALKIAETEHK